MVDCKVCNKTFKDEVAFSQHLLNAKAHTKSVLQPATIKMSS